MMKSGLGKIFLKFLHALTMSFLSLNFDQKYKFSNKNNMVSAWRNFKNIFPRVEFVIYCVLSAWLQYIMDKIIIIMIRSNELNQPNLNGPKFLTLKPTWPNFGAWWSHSNQNQSNILVGFGRTRKYQSCTHLFRFELANLIFKLWMDSIITYCYLPFVHGPLEFRLHSGNLHNYSLLFCITHDCQFLGIQYIY